MTNILGILLAVAVAAAASAGWYAKILIEDKAELKAALTQANEETSKQKQLNADLRVEHAKQIAVAGTLAEEKEKDNATLQREIRRINERLASSKKAATLHPERYGAVATFRLRRSMRNICRSGEGSQTTCKIKAVRPAKTGAGPASEPDPNAAQQPSREASNQ